MKYMMVVDIPQGNMALIEEDGFLVEARFLTPDTDVVELINENEIHPGEGTVLEEAAMELEEYFDERRTVFQVPLKPEGTPFQKKVWEETGNIPYGELRSYKQVAEALGNGNKSRAVGQALHKNPLPVFIPCHRVIASDNTLGGYGGGLERKYYLLMLEGAI